MSKFTITIKQQTYLKANDRIIFRFTTQTDVSQPSYLLLANFKNFFYLFIGIKYLKMECANPSLSTTRSVKVLPKKVSAELPQTYTLSDEQKKYLADNGFLVIKQLIDFQTLYSFKKRFSLICKGIEDKGNMLLVKEPSLVKAGVTGEAAVNKLQDIHYDEVFTNYTEHPRLLHVVSQIIGEDISAVHSMYINKPPGTSRHPPHQDLFYLPFRPQEWVTAAWTAIDDVFPENGCLFVVPGSHRDNKLHDHGNVPDSNRLYHGILDEGGVAPEHERVYLEMAPGDTALFHPLLVHGSGANRSQGYRRCISCHFANSGCASVELAGSPLAREVEQEYFKKMGLSALSYTDGFRLKSKHVKGVKSNL